MEGTEHPTPSSSFGTLLRRFRLAANLSQDALAEQAAMSTNGIGALERGDRRYPQRATLALLAKALSLNAEERRTFEAAAARPIALRSFGSAEHVTEFRALLRRLRMAAGLSQEALAEKARISAAAVGAYERGLRTAPHRDTVALLADASQLEKEQRHEFEAAARKKIAFPAPPSPAGEHPHDASARDNLPLPATPFLGRQSEHEEIARLLATNRLVTLTGAGGIGKTRVALTVASTYRGAKRDGVWFVSFGSLNNDANVLTHVATVLGIVAPSVDTDVMDAFAAQIKTREMFLVLDNCEHVADTVGALVAAILRTCPSISMLATSRERLRVSGEAIFRVPPLPVPAAGPVSALEARTFAAIELFVRSATLGENTFELTDARVDDVVAICRRLDGMPLALELAASRVPTLGLAELRAQLARRVLLSGGGRDMPARQRTLDATLTWSYDLLEAHEQLLFRRLRVFAEGWTLDAAESTCADDALSVATVHDALAALVEKSLLGLDVEDGSARYFMLQVTREYVLAIAAARDDGAAELVALRKRHAAYFCKTTVAAEKQYHADERGEWHDPLDRDGENIRTAIRNALSDGEAEVAGHILVARRIHFAGLWSPSEVMSVLESCCAALKDPPRALAARLWGFHAFLAGNLGMQAVAEASAARAVKLAREAEDANVLFSILNQSAQGAARFGDFARARTTIHEASTLAAVARPSVREALSYDVAAAFVAMVTGNVAEAATVYRGLLNRPRLDFGSDVTVTANLASIELNLGNYRKTISLVQSLFERRTRLLQRDSAHHLRSTLMLSRAEAHIHVNEYAEALHLAQRALAVSKDKADRANSACALACVALICAATGRFEAAATLFGYTEAASQRDDSGAGVGKRILAGPIGPLEVTLANLSRNGYETFAARGFLMSPSDAASLGLGVSLSDA
jgi:predicted ATPase/transcriptional regulator with XRE-family HTH domain